MSTTRPPGLTSSRACVTASGVPAVSTTRSTPSRPEKERAASASGPSTAAWVLSAPSSAARVKRRRERLTTITRAPPARSTCRARSPSVPAPTIAADSPVAGLPRFTARTTTASGSTSSSASRSAPAEVGRQHRAGTRTSSAKPPSTLMPIVILERHRLRLPSRQSGHRARVVRLDDDGIARADLPHVGRDALDPADELVPHHAGIGDGPAAAPDLVVGPAQAGGDDPDHDLARLGLRIPRGLDAKIVRPVENRRFHGANLLDGRGRGNYAAEWPPSRKSVWPVMKSELADAR